MKPYYADDLIELWHGDCREVDAWLAADVLVTDPPYGMAYKSGRTGRGIANDEDTAARDTALKAWGDKPALVFGRWSVPHPSLARMCLTWDKGLHGMGDLGLPWGLSTEEIYVIGSGFTGRRGGSVIRTDRVVGVTIHPNEKPVGLMKRLIQCCPPGVVADPFAGSGSTLRAAKDLGRRAVGVELDERYCEVIASRLAQEVLPLW